MARLDLQKLLNEAKEEKEINDRLRRLRKKAPHPTNAFRVDSAGWRKALRKKLRLERTWEDKELERAINRAATQARYYEQNKARLNYKRVLRARQPKATFKRARRRAELRGQAWELTFEQWWSVWKESPDVWNPAKGYSVPAWEMRGGNYKTDTQMVRINPEGSWSTDNVRIQIPEV